MKATHTVAFILTIIGGLNWLLVGFGWNLVDAIFGVGSTGSMIVYIIVGLSAIWLIIDHKKTCSCCVKDAGTPNVTA
jgi:uncharacterized membrane protein YuzA (DUF378 family)